MKKPRTIASIQRTVAEFYNVPPEHLESHRMTAELTRARHVAIYLTRELTTKSTATIGRSFRRDHSTILAAVEQIEEKAGADPTLRAELKALAVIVERTTVGEEDLLERDELDRLAARIVAQLGERLPAIAPPAAPEPAPALPPAAEKTALEMAIRALCAASFAHDKEQFSRAEPGAAKKLFRAASDLRNAFAKAGGRL